MGKSRGVIALLAIGGFLVAGQANATNIGVSGLKLIAIDKLTAAGKSKMVYVSKDPAITKTNDNDAATISADFQVTYQGALGTAAGEFNIPTGLSNGTDGWLVNKDTVAKYVNKGAPGGPTGAKVVVVKPTKVLKLVGKNLGDTMTDLIGAGAPAASVFTAFTVTETSGTNIHCSEFPTSVCVFKEIAAGSGRKLVCKNGVADPACTAAGPGPTAAVLKFTTGPAGGTCGESRSGGSGGTVLKTLTCGGLNIGGGASTVPEGPTPDGADTFFNASCTTTSCTISARTAAETGTLNNCSEPGCFFGPFLSIANGGLSTCVKNTFSTAGGGTLDLTTGAFSGSVPLTSSVFVTGNAAAPCPDCISGMCSSAAANAGAACTAINTSGDSYECLPGGSPLTPFGVDLTPIGTGTQTATGPTFCPGQDATAPGLNGCFADPSCDYIEERGADAAGISLGGAPASTTLASVFCIPATGNFLIDGAADLPGPGATSLPGTLDLF